MGAVGVLAAVAGCGSQQPPRELVNARAAYARANNGPAAQLDPADLHVAKQTLDQAERSFADDGASNKTRSLAYTAERRAQIAEVRARTVAANQQRDAIIARTEAERAAALQSARSQLGQTKEQLEEQRRAFESEQQRREEAERRAKQTQEDLAKVASVKLEPRGMVITLSGGVIFQSGKSTLNPNARAKLDEVARALAHQDKDSKILIEGHTDSVGTDEKNQQLSEARANEVKKYLATRGISEDRLTTAGFGESQPIADNKSPEGRANNRRVEIIVQPPQKSPGGSQGNQP
jgi:outer membrane protein OmpA-like peptidoglycan-associated protein